MQTLDELIPILQGIRDGKPWQWKRHDGLWCDPDSIGFLTRAEHGTIRLAPWTLSRHLHGFRPLAEGEAWHRETEWTEDMLFKGFRPLLVGESIVKAVDQYSYEGRNWDGADGSILKARRFDFHRTHRPLPPIPDADGWYEWHGGECPVDKEKMVEYKMRGGGIDTTKARHILWSHSTNEWAGDVVAYRIVPAPKLVPISPEDVLPGTALRPEITEPQFWFLITGVYPEGMGYTHKGGTRLHTWEGAFRQGSQILLPGRDPVTGWEFCHKAGGGRP